MKDYITYIRKLVGNNKIIMNAAACIITNENNEILLQHRSDDHYWGLPGGIMELGETEQDTCIREVFEETGLKVKPMDFLGTFHNKHKVWPNKDEAHVVCAVFTADIIGGHLNTDNAETLDLNYFSYENLPNINAPDHLTAITQYYQTNKR
ncbi:MAG: NUDIX domain-containing protein [Candidatus Izimaplasma sp.]|nr:NUDIX domain-containing protein [Candidatus Izimaplasma bacterium]